MTTYTMDSSSVSDVRVKTDAAFPTIVALLFALVYTQGYIERIGVSSSIVRMTIEIPVLMILMHLINRGVRQFPPGFFLITLYVIWTVVSAVFNRDGLGNALLYCRYVVYAYIVFAAVWSTPLTRTAVTRIGVVIAFLFIFQIVASAHEAFVRGERIEAHVGALYADGGALATEFPLLAMGLTVPFYFFYRRNVLLLVLSWAFLLVGYASGKRAIYLLGPLLYFFILAWHVARVRTVNALRQSLWAVLVSICFIPLFFAGISRSHGISERHSRSALERVAYVVNVAVGYTTAERQGGRTTGRTATNRRVLSTLWSATGETVLFGWGPSAKRIGEDERYEALMITYGICGWAQDVICIGWPGMLIYVLFHLYMFLRLRSCPPPRHSGYWMALRFGAEIGFVVMLISHISYSSSFTTCGHLSYVYFFVLALLMSPQHRHLVQSAS